VLLHESTFAHELDPDDRLCNVTVRVVKLLVDDPLALPVQVAVLPPIVKSAKMDETYV